VFSLAGGNLYRLKSTGGHYALIKKSGKQIRRSLKTNDCKLAGRKLAKFKLQIGNFQKDNDTLAPTFTGLARHYLETRAHTVKPSTVKRAWDLIRHLLPFFERVALRDIQLRHCERRVFEHGNSVAAASFCHELDLLRGIFEYAIKQGWNPARSIR